MSQDYRNEITMSLDMDQLWHSITNHVNL